MKEKMSMVDRAGFAAMKVMTNEKLMIGAIAALGATAVIAGTDTTFAAVNTQVSGYMEGSLGRLLGIVSFVGGMVGGVVKQTLWPVAVGAGIAIASYYGPDLINSLATAAL